MRKAEQGNNLARLKISVLIHSYAFDDIVKLLDSAMFIEGYEEYHNIKNYSFYNGENVLNIINNFCKTISDKIFKQGIIVRPGEIENILNIIDKIFERPSLVSEKWTRMDMRVQINTKCGTEENILHKKYSMLVMLFFITSR